MARRKVTTAPVLASWAETDKALRDIRECQHTLAELAVERDRKIDAAKDTYSPYYPSFAALRRQLVKNNQDIQLITEE